MYWWPNNSRLHLIRHISDSCQLMSSYLFDTYTWSAMVSALMNKGKIQNGTHANHMVMLLLHFLILSDHPYYVSLQCNGLLLPHTWYNWAMLIDTTMHAMSSLLRPLLRVVWCILYYSSDDISRLAQSSNLLLQSLFLHYSKYMFMLG